MRISQGVKIRIPAPDGVFFAVLRIYLPDETVINGTWKRPQMQPEPKNASNEN
jgi:hypothetical protein